MALTTQQKSALEIGAAIVAGLAVLWWIGKAGAGVPSGDVTGGSLPVYGGSADPNSVAGTVSAVAPLQNWPTFPAFPPVGTDGGNAIYPSDPGAGLIPQLLQALNGRNGGGCCCGSGTSGGNPLLALVSATPPPYQAPDQVEYPPAPAVQPWYVQFNQPSRNEAPIYGGPAAFGNFSSFIGGGNFS